MKYAYYPGCSLHSSAREYDISTRAVCGALGIELSEVPEWCCCGASSAHMTSDLLGLALPVKNLLKASALDLDVAVACAACFNRLKVANAVMAGNSDASAAGNGHAGNGRQSRVGLVDQVVGAPYRGEVRVKHFIEVLAKDYGLAALGEKVKRDLSNLKVAAYYGCLLVRPPEVMAFDDPENPTLMDQLASAVGVGVVDWSHKTECCGASLSLTKTETVVRLGRDILGAARDAGADCLMVGCPLCQANLDMRQHQINSTYGTKLHMPVLYFTQVLGLALGLGSRELGLDGLLVSPRSMLQERVAA